VSSSRTRLRVDGLEDRSTPATVAGLLSAAAHTAAGSYFFRQVATDPDWMFNPASQSFLQAQLTAIFQSSQTAMTAAQAPPRGMAPRALAGLTAQAAANQRMALLVGNWTGITVAPAAPSAPAPKPTDAGMTDTMPSPTDGHWVPLGAQGLKTWDVVAGAGTPVAAGDSITVFYTGWLAANGTTFDSRRSPAAPATFALTGLIQGWQQGIPGMKPGGIRRLLVPAALGYGAAGSPPNIPANADLVFEIKLISHT
jgi:FKBP-type peptidyl-prolyl isomerase-like protein